MDRGTSVDIKKIIFVTALMFVVTGMLIFFALLQSPSKKRYADFTNGWTVVYRGKTYKGVDLDRFRFPDVKKGEHITLKRWIPDNTPDGSSLVFPLELSTISVDVGGRVIYGYGAKEYADGVMVGSGVHVIRIPDGGRGKPISIVIKVGENSAFTYFSKLALDETSWGFTDYLNDNIYPVIISISLIMAGIIILVISVFIAFMRDDWVRINQTGMLFFVIGCWNMCEINAIQIFSVDFKWNTFVRYFFGIISILPVLRMISGAHSEKKLGDAVLQKVIFFTVQLLIIAGIILSLLNRIHICNTRYIYEVLGVVSMGIIFFIEWKDYRNKDILSAGRFREQLVCFFVIGIEAVRYIANRVYNFQSPVLRHSFLLYGTVILVMMMLGSYIFELYQSYVQRAEEKALKSIAYTDGLTGLLNRSFCKDRMEELDKTKHEYYMISFDVNGLKKINDTRGHLMGDKLLTTFADLLSRCFSDIGNVIRPGGDEFLVISDDASKNELISRLRWLKSMEKDAEKTLGFPVRASYGIAARSEVPGHTTEEVYYLADQRMYEMKTREKGGANSVY